MNSEVYECQECHEVYCLNCEGGSTEMCSDCLSDPVDAKVDHDFDFCKEGN